MGKAVPKGIKARANFLMQEFPESFSEDFEKNKEFINSLDLPFLTRLNRNLIAGFISRKVKASNKEKAREEKKEKAKE